MNGSWSDGKNKSYMMLISVAYCFLFLAGYKETAFGVAQQGSSSTQGLVSHAYLVGQSMVDITGPAVNLQTAGYGAPAPKTTGIHQRLMARTFVISDPDRPVERVALVTADLCYMTGIVRSEVLRRLNLKFGDLYRQDNVLITATHTHGAPGGFSQHIMYNLPSGGFSPRNFEIIVDGITRSIEEATARLVPSDISMVTGSISGATRNRSLDAFENNPEEWKAQLPHAVDESVTQLRFDSQQGALGILQWFAIHGTSMNKYNHLISGDNKGYAAWRLEKDFGAGIFGDLQPGNNFVAAFANSNAGDSSPNIDGDVDGDGDWECLSNTNLACTEQSGHRQYVAAKKFYSHASQARIQGPVRSIIKFIAFPDMELRDEYTEHTQQKRVCEPALGISMAAGSAEDGPGIGKEGVNCENAGSAVKSHCRLFSDPCQYPKPAILPTSKGGRYGFTARTLPVQIIALGPLLIAAVPAEVTAMAGHLLKQSILDYYNRHQVVGKHMDRVVLAAYSNEYSNYVTTPYEFATQHYEGGSTLFGETTLAAYQTAFADLIDELLDMENHGLAADVALRTRGEVPEFEKWPRMKAKLDLKRDGLHEGEYFGQILQQPRLRYANGDTVSATFRGSNLNFHDSRKSHYVRIERFHDGRWQPYADEHDFFVRLLWARDRDKVSTAEIQWDIREFIDPGTYRIGFYGKSRRKSDAAATPFEGLSRSFEVSF